MKITSPFTQTRILLRSSVFFIALLSMTALPILLNPPSTRAGSDTYPTSIGGCTAVTPPPSGSFTCDLKDSTQDIYFDPWLEENRECTSYVAWMLHSINGFEMPFHANAVDWKARAQAYGYTVNMTPAIGSIYWSPNPTNIGHVGWVESVSADGSTVTYEDYNSGWPTNPGFWGEHTVATSSAGGYIHFKDTGGGTIGSPARSDVDNNGGADLFAMVPSSNGVLGYSMLSTYQSFLAPQQWWNGAGYGWSGVTPLVGDVNGDKKADLVFLTNEGANGTKAFVALSNGTSFGTPQLWQTMTGLMYSGIKASLGDVDGNGCEDLVLTTNETTGSKAFVLPSTCQGFLAPEQWWDGSGYSWSGITPMVSDATGDKKADYMFITDEGTNGTKAFVATSNGSTGFNTAQLWQTMTGLMYSGIKITAGDADGNGCSDFVLTTNETTGSKGFVLLSTCQSFLAPQQWWDGTGFTWSGVTPFTGDVNGDKKADYAIMTDEGANGVKVFVSTSNGSSFAASQQWSSVPGWGYSGVKAYLK